MEIKIAERDFVFAHKIKFGEGFMYEQNNSHNQERDGERSENLFIMTVESTLSDQYIKCFNLTKCQADTVARNQPVRPVYNLTISAEVMGDNRREDPDQK